VYPILGNGDREVVATCDGQISHAKMSEEVRQITTWVAQQLEPSQRVFPFLRSVCRLLM